MAANIGNEGDSAWVLASSALVLLMTPGLAFFYGGLVRDTSLINTMMMSIIAMGVISILWALVGFSLAFGDGGPVIGNFDFAVFYELDDRTWGDTAVWSLAFAVFQMTFAIIAAAILSGSLVERIRFQAYVIFIALWSLFVYVPICHWVWGPRGWMEEWGALDFAGGTVVHVSSGTSGLVAAMLLGPRAHKASTEDKPHNVPFVLLGAALLWFGWSGFNGGSAFAADAVAARALASTYLAASASMLVWTIIDSIRYNHPSSVGAMVGAVAGLVVITPAAGFVSPQGAIIMGILGAPVCYCAVVCSLVGVAYAAGVTALIFIVLKAVMRVRVLEHEESRGVDQHVHGEKAYSPAKSYTLPHYMSNQTSINEGSDCVTGVGVQTDTVTV